MDAIFRALNDPAAKLDMTGFGVMKHLATLEEANLVLARKVGRFKVRYLHATPAKRRPPTAGSRLTPAAPSGRLPISGPVSKENPP